MLSYLPFIPEINIGFGYLVPTVIIFSISGMAATLTVLHIEARRTKLNFAVLLLIYMIFFILCAIFSRGIFILSRIYLHHDFEMQRTFFQFYTTQKVFFGDFLAAFLCVPIGVAVYSHWNNIARYYDIFLLAICPNLLLSRIGDALSRYHPGKIASPSWGLYMLGQYRHEPSLYEAVSLTLLLVIAWTMRKKIRTAGRLSLFILAWASLSRFITDFFRNDDLPLESGKFTNAFYTSNFHITSIGLTLNQVAYFVLFLIFFSWLVYTFRKNWSQT